MSCKGTTKGGRFDIYKPFGDLGNSEEVGILPCDKDYELGTPNLERNENYTFVASNSSLKECLVLRLKWRPVGGGGTGNGNGNGNGKQVTLLSKLSLTLDGQSYEFSEVDIYQPSESSHVRSGRICQYGSRNLKVFVQSPYRRLRILFNGHMKQTLSGRCVFIRFSCVLNPFSEILDFYDLPQGGDLVRQDRHEQRMRFNGEYLLVDAREHRREQKTFAMWGYHVRHFLSSPDGNSTQDKDIVVSTKRLYAHMNNGQGFQIGVNKLQSGQMKEFGFTAFDIRPCINLIETPYNFTCGKLDDSDDDENDNSGELDKFELEVSGQKCTFECKGERYLGNWFRCEMNGKSGWAWLSPDDELTESQGEQEAVERTRCDLELSSKLGKVCQQVALAGSELDQGRKLVVSIDQECCRSSELVGAKAASLAQLLEFTRHNGSEMQQVVVPYGFVLTRFAHDLILADNVGLRKAIDGLTKFVGALGANSDEAQRLRNECQRVEELVRQTKLPQAIADEFWSKLTGRYSNLSCTTGSEGGSEPAGGPTPLFAVRSSSWGEDEADMSAAGQLTTVLNVKPSPEELGSAIMQCFASKFSCENVEYKRQHGQPLDMPMAVVVQEMVACDQAGVMFTCDPTTGDESLLLITANYGLGESVVSAQADPDSIRVRVSMEPSRASAADKQLEIEQVVVGKKEVVVQNLDEPTQDKSKCCLTDEEILKLARCGLAVSRYFWSQRRDIEFGFLGSQLHLFQSRPVTGLEALTHEELVHECERPNSAERCCYSRANIGEVMPYAASPLTQTYLIFAWNVSGFTLVSKFSNEIYYIPQVSADVLQEKYHSFFSVRCSMLFGIAEEEKTVLGKSMEIGFFGRELGPQPEVVEASRGFIRPPNLFQGLRYKLNTLPMRLAPKRIVLKQYAVVRQLREQVRAKKLAHGYESNKLQGLYNQMQQALRNMRPLWDNHIHLVMMASNVNVVLSAVLSQYIKDPMQLSAATNKFLAIAPDVVSAEIPRRVRAMAKLVGGGGGGGGSGGGGDAAERERFACMSPDEALAYLTNATGGASDELKRAYEDFMANFGHRCYNEFELATLSWREDPKQVVEMIQKNCLSETTGLTQQKERPQTIEQVIKSLGVEMRLKDRLLVKHVLAPKCQLMLSMRERTKDILVMFSDVLREATRQLADELVRQLRLPDRNLFYYLQYEEVKPLVAGHQPLLVMQAARRRQMFKRTFEELWKFDEIIWETVPNHMKPRRELDEAIAQAPRLSGTPASGGKVQGRVCLVSGYKELARVKPGTILVTHSTDIAFTPVFPLISGIITEVGGLISHGAVVAREYGLPSVIGIPHVCEILQDGEEILLDADNGAIVRLSKQPTAVLAN